MTYTFGTGLEPEQNVVELCRLLVYSPFTYTLEMGLDTWLYFTLAGMTSCCGLVNEPDVLTLHTPIGSLDVTLVDLPFETINAKEQV